MSISDSLEQELLMVTLCFQGIQANLHWYVHDFFPSSVLNPSISDFVYADV